MACAIEGMVETLINPMDFGNSWNFGDSFLSYKDFERIVEALVKELWKL